MNRKIKIFSQTVSIWAAINLLLNGLGLLLREHLSEYNDFPIDLIFHLKYWTFQTAIFGLVTLISYLTFGKRRFTNYSFGIFQTVVFHIIFLALLKNEHNVIQLNTSWDNWGLRYLEFNGQNLTGLVGIYYPLEGWFSEGMFVPHSLLNFYTSWILLVIAYYFAVTWLTNRTLKFFTREIGYIEKHDPQHNV